MMMDDRHQWTLRLATIEYRTPIERQTSDLVNAIEQMGAHPLLTDAQAMVFAAMKTLGAWHDAGEPGAAAQWQTPPGRPPVPATAERDYARKLAHAIERANTAVRVADEHSVTGPIAKALFQLGAALGEVRDELPGNHQTTVLGQPLVQEMIARTVRRVHNIKGEVTDRMAENS